MPTFLVTAEFIDAYTGKRHFPGDTFTPHHMRQHKRLTDAGCLGEDAVANPINKPVAEMTRSELEVVAKHSFAEQMARMSDDDLRLGVERALARVNERDPALDARDAVGAGDNDPAAQARDQINNDGLFDRTVDDLKGVAASEGIDLGAATKKADIVAAIRTARAA